MELRPILDKEDGTLHNIINLRNSAIHSHETIFILRVTQGRACIAPRTRADITLRDDRYAWTDPKSLIRTGKQWVRNKINKYYVKYMKII